MSHVHPVGRARVIAEEAQGEHIARQDRMLHLYENPLDANYSKVG